MKPYQTRAGFHGLLMALAIFEIRHAKTPFRKAVACAWAGFHGYLAYADWLDKEDKDS
jgi:hypothetical protein